MQKLYSESKYGPMFPESKILTEVGYTVDTLLDVWRSPRAMKNLLVGYFAVSTAIAAATLVASHGNPTEAAQNISNFMHNVFGVRNFADAGQVQSILPDSPSAPTGYEESLVWQSDFSGK
jgi:hypothetical protein